MNYCSFSGKQFENHFLNFHKCIELLHFFKMFKFCPWEMVWLECLSFVFYVRDT